MTFAFTRFISSFALAITLSLTHNALAQSSDGARRSVSPSEIATAKSPQCTQIGTKLIALLVRDDVRGALDFQQFYNTFGCPTTYLIKSFGCTIANRPPEGKPIEAQPVPMTHIIDACWDNPDKPKLDTASDKAAPPPTGNKPNPPPATNQKKPNTAPPAEGGTSK
ncbi:MAG: hypothetical protein R3E60_01045 [Alphaproteobacteria bacterium]